MAWLKQTLKALAAVVALLALAFPPGFVLANPTGSTIVNGTVNIQDLGSTLTIQQLSQRAIIDWSHFSIAGNELTEFQQPNASSAVLNRVSGSSQSVINGMLRANGNVFLLNPNGILISPNGVVDVGGFVASTLDVSNAEFLAGGDLQFLGASQASVVNLGKIMANSGDVFLIAAQVSNGADASIRADNGTVGLAAGNDVLLTQSGEERVFVRGASGANKNDGVVNQGTIDANVAELKAHNGNIYGMAVRNEGRVSATSVTRQGGQIFLRAQGSTNGSAQIENTGDLIAKRSSGAEGGEIVIDSGEGGTTNVGGMVDASGVYSKDKPEDLDGRVGGQIWILGSTVNLLPEEGGEKAGALILADGDARGGNIFIGGGHLGEDETLFNASSVSVGAGVTIEANAWYEGDGGQIVVFAGDDLTFEGYAEAKGGADAGNGGRIELSGSNTLALGSLMDAVDISAENGVGGTLLLDPSYFNILAGAGDGDLTTNTLYADDISAFLDEMGSLEIYTSGAGLEMESGDGSISIEEEAQIEWFSQSNLSFNAFGDFLMGSDSLIASYWNDNLLEGGNVSILAGGTLAIGEVESAGASIMAGSGNIKLANWEPGLEGTPGGILLFSSDIISGNGDIEILGRGQNELNAATVIGDSFVYSSDGGNILIEGMGSYSDGVVGDGVLIYYSGIGTTPDGSITIRGYGGSDEGDVDREIDQVDGTGVAIGYSYIGLEEPESEGVGVAFASVLPEPQEVGKRAPGDPGTISIEGIGGEGDSNGVYIEGESEVYTYTYSGLIQDNLAVYFSGKGSGGDYENGTGYAVLIEDPTGGEGLPEYPIIYGMGTPLDVTLRTLGGMVSTNYISAERMFLSDQSPEIENFFLDNNYVDFLTSSPAGDITVYNYQSITLGNIGSAGTLEVNAFDNIYVNGVITAGTQVDLNVTSDIMAAIAGGGQAAEAQIGIGGDFSSIDFAKDSSITAPDVNLNGDFYEGSTVGVEGVLDITNFNFNDILYVQGLSMEDAKIIASSASGQNITIMTELNTEGEVPYVQPVAYIDGITSPDGETPLPFYDFYNFSGGAQDDTITIDIQKGMDFEGNLFGGGGNDEFVILPTGGGVTGTVYGDNGMGTEPGVDGLDTLNYSNFTEGFTIVYNQQSAPGVTHFEQVEKVIGSAGIDTLVGSPGSDTFTINGNNSGRINDGFFESFEILNGGNGNDIFQFLNQATVNSVGGGIGSDLLWINDSNLGGTNTYFITANQISRNPTYNFGGIEVVQINFGPGNDTVVTGPRSFIQLLNGGAGYDTIRIPGQTTPTTNPIVIGSGEPIAHVNFENPSSVVNPNSSEIDDTQDSGNILTLQIGNNQQGGNNVQIGGEEQNNFNSNPNQNNGGQPFGGNFLPAGGGAFSAAITTQANIITVDGTDYLTITATSLDGSFTLPPIIVVNQLSGSLQADAYAELAGAIGYDGPMLMVYTDGPFAIDLSGPPDAAIAALLQALLSPDAARELYAALGLDLVMPVTSEDGVVSILSIPAEPNAATIASIAQILNDAAFGELSSALDGQ